MKKEFQPLTESEKEVLKNALPKQSSDLPMTVRTMSRTRKRSLRCGSKCQA